MSKKIDLEYLEKIVKSCKDKTELFKKFSKEYSVARRHVMWSTWSSHMPKRVPAKSKYDDTRIMEEIGKYKTISEFKKGSRGYYRHVLRKRKHLLELFKRQRNLPYSKEQLIEIAKNCDTINDMFHNHSGAYSAARDMGVIEEIKKFTKKRSKVMWTEEALREDASKYSSIAEWHEKNHSSYMVAWRRGLLEELSRNMSRYGGTSKPEQEILKLVREKFNSAKRINIKNSDSSLPFKRVQIDIAVPELKKGVEFDGNYWHSFDVMKKHRPHLTDEQILNYKEIKTKIYNSAGYQVLHINESEWNSNKQECVERIFNFLS